MVLDSLRNSLMSWRNILEDRNGFDMDSLYVGRLWYRDDNPKLYSISHRMIFKKSSFNKYDVYEYLPMDNSKRQRYLQTPNKIFYTRVIDIVPLKAMVLAYPMNPTREEINAISEELYELDKFETQEDRCRKLVR